MVRDKQLCTSWEKKMAAKREKELVKQYSQQLKDEKTRQKEVGRHGVVKACVSVVLSPHVRVSFIISVFTGPEEEKRRKPEAAGRERTQSGDSSSGTYCKLFSQVQLNTWTSPLRCMQLKRQAIINSVGRLHIQVCYIQDKRVHKVSVSL